MGKWWGTGEECGGWGRGVWSGNELQAEEEGRRECKVGTDGDRQAGARTHNGWGVVVGIGVW